MLDAPDKIDFINQVNQCWREARRSGNTEDLPCISAYRAGAYDIHNAISASHSIRSDGSPVTSSNYTPDQVQAFIDKDLNFARYGTEVPAPEQLRQALP